MANDDIIVCISFVTILTDMGLSHNHPNRIPTVGLFWSFMSFGQPGAQGPEPTGIITAPPSNNMNGQ